MLTVVVQLWTSGLLGTFGALIIIASRKIKQLLRLVFLLTSIEQSWGGNPMAHIREIQLITLGSSVSREG